MKPSSKHPLPAAQPADDTGDHAPIYGRIAEQLRQALSLGALPPGTVLLEGPLAELFGVTRMPVRQALRELETLGLVSRFDGRGLLAGAEGQTPRRIPLTAAMLGLDDAAEPVRKALGWESIYQAVEHDIVHLSVFGAYRINEMELARHFGVGRTAARDVLLRLESLGLISKDERLRWTVTPLDERRIRNLYELRWLLEPAALESAAKHTPKDEVAAMAERLRKAKRRYPRLTRAELDELEHDLHVTLLGHCPNDSIVESLQRTRCILTLSKHVLGAAAPMPHQDPFMQEHLEILDALVQGQTARAQKALRRHLENSCQKVINRVGLIQQRVPAPQLAYIG
ncbi:GntR family transcriptional regulator [Burkholderia sp. F1]|uniref:GntR family transcriptional regulator n=1 Tax=Burkholderia sp. F1 TaxID=3366817 RepID=UPI003D754128